jgi:hypothetical protein
MSDRPETATAASAQTGVLTEISGTSPELAKAFFIGV